MKKAFIIPILLIAVFFSGIALVQAKPDQLNPASDIERGVFVHYPHAKGQAKGVATGDQINDFKYSGIHWLGIIPIVNYKINPINNKGLLNEQVVSAMDLAFQEWINHNLNDGKYIRFSDDGITNLETSTNPSRDYTNTVSFEPLNTAYPNAIAVTFYWYNRSTKGLLETDTVFNSDLSWAINEDSNSYDLQNIATHEFGHWLLLGDLYSLRDSALTMYGYGGLGETIKSTLGRGDISGINKIY
ncbi:MAG: matrixin family metalloprotease [Candidatus Paceibacterota bacterium]|jgi:hypothetical protein